MKLYCQLINKWSSCIVDQGFKQTKNSSVTLIPFLALKLQEQACKSHINLINKMYTGKNVDFHHYCGDLSQSIDYLQEEMGNESPIYTKHNLVSFRTFPKNLPAYSSENQLEAMSLQEQLNQLSSSSGNKYKCFKCFGTNRDINFMNGVETACTECQGNEVISDSHPLASILEKVLRLKLPHLMQKNDEIIRLDARKSRDLNSLFDSQKSIQQEPSMSYFDDNSKQCSCCYNQFQPNLMVSCIQCKDFSLCNTCFEKKKYNHPASHQLVHRGVNKISLRFLNPQTMKKISEEGESEQTSNYQDSSTCEIRCHNCSQSIEECYEACLNCEKEGYQFIICAQCSESRNYSHNQDHELGMKTLAQASKLMRLSSKPSASQSQLTQPTPSKHKSKILTRESIVSFENYEHEQQKQEDYKHESIFSKFSQEPNQKENVSNNFSYGHFNPGQLEEQGQDFTHLLVNKKKKGKKMEESVVNIDMQCSIDVPSQKSDDFASTVTPYAFSNTNNQRVEFKSFQTNPEEYIFNDYQCDICKIMPIKNKRYHCKECENFDLCEMCFLVRAKRHEHKDYDLIDGLEMMKKTRESMLKVDLMKTKLGNSRASISRNRLSEYSSNMSINK